MWQEPLLSNFTSIAYKTRSYFEFIFLIFIILTISSSYSASIAILSSSNYHQFELITNKSHRNLFLRQYFIDLLNISHSSLVQSMILNHHLAIELEQPTNRKRRYLTVKPFTETPTVILNPINYTTIDHDQVQSIFQWSHSLESLSSVELIYHCNSIQRKKSSIPIRILIKQLQTLIELFSINTYLQVDSIRNFYFLNMYNYFSRISNQNLIIEIIVNNQTCQISHAYIIISLVKSNYLPSYGLQQTSTCQLKTIQISFQELGLAYLIIRPKEYIFTYCDGSCSNFTFQKQLQRSIVYTFLQSIIRRKNSHIPRLSCVPSQLVDDNFLLRQIDGTMAIHPVKDVIVKQCTCL